MDQAAADAPRRGSARRLRLADEIKYDGYRLHVRIHADKIQLLTRTGLDWSHRYERTIEALRSLRVNSAYLDGELCALNADGVPAFSRLLAAMDKGRADHHATP